MCSCLFAVYSHRKEQLLKVIVSADKELFFSSLSTSVGLTHKLADDKSKIFPGIGKNDVFLHVQTTSLQSWGFSKKNNL